MNRSKWYKPEYQLYLFLSLLTVLPPTATAVTALAGEKGPHASKKLIPVGGAIADIYFGEPARYAIMRHEVGQFRTLHSVNDILFHPEDPVRSLTVIQVKPAIVVVRTNPGGRQHSVELGKPIPELPLTSFVGTVKLNQLRYRFKTVEHLTKRNPILLSIKGSQALLEMEVLTSQAASELPLRASQGPLPLPKPKGKLEGGLLSKIGVLKVDGDSFELDGASLRMAFENPVQTLSDIQLKVFPALSVETGPGLKLTSAVADGVLDQRGFTVTSSKIAGRFGIQVGDTIISLNGHRIYRLHDAWMTFQEIFIRNRQPKLRVNVLRDGRLITKTYRVSKTYQLQ